MGQRGPNNEQATPQTQKVTLGSIVLPGALQGRARGLFQGFEIKRAELAAGVDDHSQQTADLGLDGVLDGAQRFLARAARDPDLGPVAGAVGRSAR